MAKKRFMCAEEKRVFDLARSLGWVLKERAGKSGRNGTNHLMIIHSTTGALATLPRFVSGPHQAHRTRRILERGAGQGRDTSTER